MKYYTERIDVERLDSFETTMVKQMKDYLETHYRDKLTMLEIDYQVELQYYNYMTDRSDENIKVPGYNSILNVFLTHNGKTIVESGEETGGFSPFMVIVGIGWSVLQRKYSVNIWDDLTELKKDLAYSYSEILKNGYEVEK